MDLDAPGERARDPEHVEYGELPELTRALRAMGSARRSLGSLHSQFFHTLLDSRRRAEDGRNAPARVRAFDASELSRALDRAIDRIVAEWPDKRDSVRRALRAELEERARPYATALDMLANRAATALAAQESDRLSTWRAWTSQLALVFAAADQTWMALRSVVEALPRK